MKKIAFYTLGCRTNQSESSSLRHVFETKGYQITSCMEEADILVINTCTVTNKSDSDTRRFLNKILKKNPTVNIAVTGCQVELEKDQFFRFPNIKWVIGNENKMSLPEILASNPGGYPFNSFVSEIKEDAFQNDMPAIDHSHTRANLKIQDGCDFFCSYCIIPYVRGRARSRIDSDVLKEAKTLIDSGFKELVLTGINLGTYFDHKKNLCDITSDILNIQGHFRLRLSSIEPVPVIDDIIKLIKEKRKLCRFMHVPLQSGSNTILKKMGRKYNLESYGTYIRHAFEAIPGICLGTDIITGFPGESDELFQETVKFIDQLPLSYFHVFSYSERPKVKSRNFMDKVPQKKIKERSQILRTLSTKKRFHFMQQFIGTFQDVLFEQKKAGYFEGLLDNYIRVKVKTSKDLHNQFHSVLLEEIDGLKMTGNLRSIT